MKRQKIVGEFFPLLSLAIDSTYVLSFFITLAVGTLISHTVCIDVHWLPINPEELSLGFKCIRNVRYAGMIVMGQADDLLLPLFSWA